VSNDLLAYVLCILYTLITPSHMTPFKALHQFFSVEYSVFRDLMQYCVFDTQKKRNSGISKTIASRNMTTMPCNLDKPPLQLLYTGCTAKFPSPIPFNMPASQTRVMYQSHTHKCCAPKRRENEKRSACLLAWSGGKSME
jgi:hypothetical protein